MGKKKQRKKRGSTIRDHKKVGTKLIPPMMQLPEDSIKFTFWMNDRLPEMLWACLIRFVFESTVALSIFENIAELGFEYRERYKKKEWGMTHSSLVCLPDDIFRSLIGIVTTYPKGIDALRPILLFDSLPGIEKWRDILNVEPKIEDWVTLSQAVEATLDHQSDLTTDVRWLSLMFQVALGRMQVDLSILPPSIQEELECITNYRHYDSKDPKIESIRSSIRSMEQSVDSISLTSAKSKWSSSFWEACLKKPTVFL